MARANPLSNGTAVLIGVAAAAVGGALGWYFRSQSNAAPATTSTGKVNGLPIGVAGNCDSVENMVAQAAGAVQNPALQQPPNMNPAFLGSPGCGACAPNLLALQAASAQAAGMAGYPVGMGAPPVQQIWAYLREDNG